VTAGRGDARVLLTCEHASAHLPRPWSWHAEDEWLRGTHWAADLGAAELARDLAEEWGATAVLARFSRLLADPNRPEDSPELVRTVAEGREIAMNRAVDARERARRVALWQSYHRAVDTTLATHAAPMIFAVHSFTPLYEGEPRHLEIGVLYDREEALAHELRDALAASAFEVELNEPYSGREGLIYSADRHAHAHGRRALEIEVRQDLCVDDAFRRRLSDALAVVPRMASGLGV